MINRDNILNSIKKTDDRLLVSRALDKAEKAKKVNSILHTDFLDPYQHTIVGKVLERIDEIEYYFTGGYDGAERVIAVFSPAFIYGNDTASDIPLKCLEITKSGREIVSHRDYLGALMGLGIKREKIGDILVGEDSCNVVVIGEIAGYIALNLSAVGSVRVKVEIINMEDILWIYILQKRELKNYAIRLSTIITGIIMKTLRKLLTLNMIS
jgi:RNA-binding protein YlmH